MLKKIGDKYLVSVPKLIEVIKIKFISTKYVGIFHLVKSLMSRT